jgi:hypothetical protein
MKALPCRQWTLRRLLAYGFCLALLLVVLLVLRYKILYQPLPIPISDKDERFQHIVANLQYYQHLDNLQKTPLPVNKERFLLWGPWEAGFNNRRMTFEIFYV